jgi:hypothetical protein
MGPKHGPLGPQCGPIYGPIYEPIYGPTSAQSWAHHGPIVGPIQAKRAQAWAKRHGAHDVPIVGPDGPRWALQRVGQHTRQHARQHAASAAVLGPDAQISAVNILLAHLLRNMHGGATTSFQARRNQSARLSVSGAARTPSPRRQLGFESMSGRPTATIGHSDTYRRCFRGGCITSPLFSTRE